MNIEFDIVEKTHSYKIFNLDDEIKIVASVNTVVSDWSAYFGKGTTKKVAQWGDKVSKSNAERHFPEIAKEYRWRD